MLVIDGSFGEGGGQILRTSLSLAAITGQEITVENIRAGREKPGLRPQHLTGAIAVAEICGAEMKGGEVGSTKLVFRPRKVAGGDYVFDVSRIRASAGSVNLVLQTVLWPLAFSGRRSHVVVRGGTHVPHAPTYNYVNDVFLPTVARMGLLCHYELIKAGYYPEGGGEVRIDIRPVEELMPIDLVQREEPVRVELTSAVSNLPESIAERQLATGMERLRSLHPAGETKQYPSRGKGTVFFGLASAGPVKAGFQSLGELRKRAEKVAEESCEELLAYMSTGMALDEHLADQLIIPMALAKGHSRFTTCRISNHVLTNIAVVQKFLPVHFHVSHALGEPGAVETA